MANSFGLSTLLSAMLMFVPMACAEETIDQDSTAAAYYLTPSQLEATTARARQGSGDSAYRLAQYYLYVRADTSQALQWLRVAHNVGHREASYELIMTLYGLGTPSSCEEAALLIKQELSRAHHPEEASIVEQLREIWLGMPGHDNCRAEIEHLRGRESSGSMQ